MSTFIAPTLPLVPPIPPSTASADPVVTSLPFYGRSLADYTESFELDLPALRTQAVLDVGAGPSSFAVEALRRGLDVVALDPLYGCPMTTLATHVQLDYARVAVESTHRLTGARLAAREALEQGRRAAAQRFLADYETGFLHNRYLGGALPQLPFLDRSFDLVLCGYVLFGSAGVFDAEEQFAACQELVRVSTREVRITPWSGLATAELDQLTHRLAQAGIHLERRAARGGRCSLGILRRKG